MNQLDRILTAIDNAKLSHSEKKEATTKILSWALEERIPDCVNNKVGFWCTLDFCGSPDEEWCKRLCRKIGDGNCNECYAENDCEGVKLLT